AARRARKKPRGVLARLPLRALSAADRKARLRSLQDGHRAAAMAKAMDSLARRAPVGLASLLPCGGVRPLISRRCTGLPLAPPNASYPRQREPRCGSVAV